MAQGKSFFDDVKKELECSVCQELFSEVNEPKILKCLHTFCKNCLEAWLRRQREGQLSCPTCRQITECPNSNINSLPSNLFYKQMVEIVEAYSGTAQEDDSLHCGNCVEKKPLNFYCFDCNTFLCEKCAGAHSKSKLFKGHHVKEIGKFESSDVQDYARKSSVCKKHNDELRFYCENCNICICRDCAILEHRDDKNHNIVSLEQGFENKKSDITSKMKDVEAIASCLRDQKQTLEKKKVRMLGSIDQATSEIHRVAEQWISFIRQNEAAMTKKLLEQKNSFQGTFSSQMSRLDEKLIEIDNSLVFSSDVLARENLLEILNVQEILDQRFQELSSEFLVSLNFSCVKYVPNDTSPSMNDVLGKFVFTKTDPMLTTANGKGLTEGTEDEVCSFKIETRDSQGQITYSSVDKVGVDIRSVDTGNVTAPGITDSKNGCYEVKYKPKIAGKCEVCITVDGEPIVGSPFRLEVNEKRRQSQPSGPPVSLQSNQVLTCNLSASKHEQLSLTRRLFHDLNNGVKLSLYQGDITDERVDAIVNAANERLLHGSGVAAAIVQKGGRQIQEESTRKIQQHGPLNVGEATFTNAGNLACRYVIHTVGPVWRKHANEECKHLLHEACIQSLHIASVKLQLSSLALTAISSGIFGMPKEICAQVMLSAVEAFSSSKEAEFSTLRDVRIVIIDEQTLSVFQEEFVKRYLSQEPSPKTVTTRESLSNEHTATPLTPQSSVDELLTKSDGDSPQDRSTLPPKEAMMQETIERSGEGQFLPGREKLNRWQKSEPNCSMCINFNDDPVYPLKCGRDHHYCTSCIKYFIEKTQVCPQCHREGIRRGNQPFGCMTWVTVKQNSLPGYEDCDVIIMYFKFEEGIQGPEHPNPGKFYSPLYTSAFLPHNSEGTEVCILLQKAFDAGLLFTIGKSSTTGQENMIIWNGIELKTSHSGRPANYGYPDPNYIDRVKKQLAEKGITPATAPQTWTFMHV